MTQEGQRQKGRVKLVIKSWIKRKAPRVFDEAEMLLPIHSNLDDIFGTARKNSANIFRTESFKKEEENRYRRIICIERTVCSHL